MGSRALSHDSIFLAQQVLTDVEPARILSQENVHSKIKALQVKGLVISGISGGSGASSPNSAALLPQLKLQQQKWHLGPPPLLLPIKQAEDPESSCQHDSPAHSPPTNSGTGIPTSPTFAKVNTHCYMHLTVTLYGHCFSFKPVFLLLFLFFSHSFNPYLFHFHSHPNFHSLNLRVSLPRTRHVALKPPNRPPLNPRWTSAFRLSSLPPWIALLHVTECPSGPETRGPAPRKGLTQ